MAKKITGPQMIVANRLTDGRVVFLKSDGDWTSVASEAAFVEDDADVEALQALAAKSAADNIVLSVELIEAVVDGGKPRPAHIKFAMQAKGPSVRPDLGYQVSPNWEG